MAGVEDLPAFFFVLGLVIYIVLWKRPQAQEEQREQRRLRARELILQKIRRRQQDGATEKEE